MKAEITVLQGKRRGEVFHIQTNQKLLFGRDLSCDVQLFDDGVSRKHFIIEGKGNHFLIYDLNSANGTWVNGSRTTTRILRTGDVLRAGNCCFTFHLEAGASTTVQPGGKASGAAPVTISDARQMSTALARKFNISALGTGILQGDSAERYLNSLRALYEVGNAIHAVEDLSTLFIAIMDKVQQVVPADRAYLVMYHPEDQTFETVVVRRTDAMGNPTNVEDGELNLSRTVLTECVQVGNSILSSDLAADDRFKAGKSIVAQNIRSVLCVPVATPDMTIGAIYLDNLGEGKAPFGEFELQLVGAIGRQAGIAIHRSKLFQDLEDMFYGTIRALVATIEAKDRYTHGHSERVTEFSMAIAESMGLGTEELDNIRLGAILHDIGKIAVPDRVLNKPSRLSEAEFLLIKNHPVHGAEIIKHISNIEPVIAVVLHHHEKWNGTGYPDGLAGDDIPVQARVVAVADAFDAMTSSRPYRSNFSVEQVIREFERCADDHFDGRIVQHFVKLLETGTIRPHYKTAKNESSISITT
ncbi:MAG: HD domain-containing phosphohydrolase [Planctomycetota bacterium]